MKDHALRIFLFCYIVSGCLAAGDVLVAGPLGIQLQTLEGEPAGPQLSTISARVAEHDLAGRLLEAEGALTAGEWWERAWASAELATDMSVELFKMLAGLYVFDVLTIFGMPSEITAVVTTTYTILLARSLLGHLPAVTGAATAAASMVRPTVGDASRILASVFRR